MFSKIHIIHTLYMYTKDFLLYLINYNNNNKKQMEKLENKLNEMGALNMN